MWHFFQNSTIVQAATYHDNLKDDKSDFKDIHKIKTSGTTEGFNHEEIMPFDLGCFINAVRRVGKGTITFDALIHGDNQILKLIALLIKSAKTDLQKQQF